MSTVTTETVTAADLRVGDRIIVGGYYETVSAVADAGPGYRGRLIDITVVRRNVTTTYLGGHVVTGQTKYQTATWVATDPAVRVVETA